MAADKDKALRISVEFKIGHNKIHRNRVQDAYEIGLLRLIEEVQNSMPEKSVEEVSASMEWVYIYDRDTTHLANGTLNPEEPPVAAPHALGAAFPLTT
jgi:hypothetical protein